MLIIFWIALIFGFYMAWSIGANDAANAMGTSVGSKAVTFREAVLIAAVFEFSGAFLAGAGVADTMRKGIVDPQLFAVLPNGGELFVLGMLASLMSAAMWIHIAAAMGWPVSTTHSIVGAITGFGVLALGAAQIQWGQVLFIVASWVTSPLLGGLLSFGVFVAIKKLILDKPDPTASARVMAPVFSYPVFVVLALMFLFKGLKNFQTKVEVDGVTQRVFDIAGLQFGAGVAVGLSFALAILGVLGTIALVRGLDLAISAEDRVDEGTLASAHAENVEKVFRWLQVLTACFVAFAHGSNDVANSIGPLAAIVGMFDISSFSEISFVGNISDKVPVPTWVLLIGAAGIVVGLASYGWKVMETVGTKITEITPSRGFAAEFGTAGTILLGSQLGVPLSTTHTLIGAVIGVGFARGMNALNLGIIWGIVKSWIYTIPFTAILTAVLYSVLKATFL